MRELKLVGFAGSLREKSYNRALLRTMVELLPLGVTLDVLTIGDLPHYDGDLDQDGERPANVDAFKAAIAASDGVVLVTPEYNHSLPGVFKNAIDWASRAENGSAFSGKVAGVMGAGGGRGTARAQYHFRQTAVFLNLRMICKPLMAVNAFEKDSSGAFVNCNLKNGDLINDGLKDRIGKLLQAICDEARLHVA